MKIYEYTIKDIIIDNINIGYKENKSKFDDLLFTEWTKAMNNGYFKYKLDTDIETKIVDDGGYSFIFQLNTKRFTEKRKGEAMFNLDKPFDLSKFNFTKIHEHEILFKLDKNDGIINDTYVIINNSPIENGHVLLVPELKACHNQVITENSLRSAIELSLLSNSYGFFVGFNSLCALASVNHLHFHAYYLDYTLPIQTLKAKKLNDYLWLFDKYYLPGLVLQLYDFENNIEIFAKNLHNITNYLTIKNIAHNLMIVKGENLIENIHNRTLRVVIWPRKAYVGSKDDAKDIKFQLAICELSGHIVIKDEDTFKNLKSDEIFKAAKEIQLDDNILEIIINDIKQLLLNQINF